MAVGDPSRSGIRGTTPLLWIVFINVTSTSTFWPILAPYATDLGANGLELGVVVGAIYATRLIIGPWIGRIADQRGYRGLLLFGNLLYVPIALAYATAGSVFALTGARLLHGVGSAIVLPMVMAVLGQQAEGRSGAAMARYNAAQWLGYALGPVVGGSLASRLEPQQVFLILIPAAVASTLVTRMVDPRHMAPPARPTERQRTGASPTTMPARLLLGYNFLIAPASLIVLSYFPLLAEERGYGPVVTGALLSLASFATAAVQPIWGRVADRTGVKPLLLIGSVGVLGSLVLLAWADVVIVAAVGMLAAGITIAGLIAGTATSAVQTGKTRSMGAYVALFHSAGSLGQAIMPLVYGVVLHQIGVSGLLTAMGVLVAVGSLAYLASTAAFGEQSLSRAES